MLDLRYLLRHSVKVSQALSSRDQSHAKTVRRILKLLGRARSLRRRARAAYPDKAAKFGTGGSEGCSSESSARLGESYARLKKALMYELSKLPNLPDPTVPVGRHESEDRLVRQHLCSTLLPAEKGALRLVWLGQGSTRHIAGAGFELLNGDEARMVRMLATFALDLHSQYFIEVQMPALLSSRAMFGSGHLPRFEKAAYSVEGTDLWLAPTVEVAFCALHSGTKLTHEKLPARYIAHQTCFRKEVGGGGVDSHLRLHQYEQVELFSLCEPSNSRGELEFILDRAELPLRMLKLQYRVIEFCRGQLPFSSEKAYRLEVFFPRSKRWVGVSTVSLAGNFLARRSRISLAPGAGNQLLHTINGSALACSRIRQALLEYGHNQNALPAVINAPALSSNNMTLSSLLN